MTTRTDAFERTVARMRARMDIPAKTITLELSPEQAEVLDRTLSNDLMSFIDDHDADLEAIQANLQAACSKFVKPDLFDKLWKPESHWDNHGIHTAEDWTDEVRARDTRLGYLDWVNNRIEQAYDHQQIENLFKDIPE